MDEEFMGRTLYVHPCTIPVPLRLSRSRRADDPTPPAVASVGMLSPISWMVAVERREAVGDQPSDVDIPQEVRTSGKAEAWAKAFGFAMSRAQAVGRLSPFSRLDEARATAARLGSACGFRPGLSHHYTG